jgi:hypothetical protein
MPIETAQTNLSFPVKQGGGVDIWCLPSAPWRCLVHFAPCGLARTHGIAKLDPITSNVALN